jgi:hypothetical protein
MSNRRKVKARAACADCGMFTVWDGRPDEYYMVAGEVWDAAGMDSGYLCVGCLENRLGRRLGPSDFTDAEVNDPGPWHTERLNDRLMGVRVGRDAAGGAVPG